jgi:tetratricopeptide (TPR) repeat protein
MLFDDRRFHEAGEQFSRAVQEGKELANAAPHDRARQNEVAHVIAWLAQTRLNQGRLREAVSLREQNLALLNSLFVRDADESDHQIELTNAQVALGSVYAATGRNKLALEHFRTAVANLERSIPLDNASAWYGTAIHARLALAAFTLDAGNRPEAAALTQSACSLADKLRDQTGANPFLLTERRDCWLMRTRLALASGRIAEALADARRAVETSKAIATGDHIADRFGQAKAYRLLGDAEKRSGSAAEASHAWSDALASMPPELTQTPREMDEYAQVLERMGRSTEATQIKSKLNAIGYHSAG